MAGTDVISLCLQPLPETDPFYAEKMKLLGSKNLGFEFQINSFSSSLEQLQILDRIIQAARIMQLDETELYFLEDDGVSPVSQRNELKSLNSILLLMNSLPYVDNSKKEVLRVLQDSLVHNISFLEHDISNNLTAKECNTDAEKLLVEWCRSHGLQTRLNIAHFDGQGRGAVASQDINIGESALEVPESLIISENVASLSEIFNILKKIDGVSVDTMLLLWSMKERYNTSSQFKMYFETLPKKFNTGLSFGIDAISLLDGTLLFEEIMQAKEHLRKQYDALFPALCTDYPEVFKLEIYTWDHFLWACELWYSNGMKVVFSDGKLRTCLVPIAGLLNHSLCPHILHYGRVGSETNTLKFNASRPCRKGQQCYLSYGTYPSSHLVTFYGFMSHGDNPYDVIPLDFDNPDNGNSPLSSGETGWASHMVRGTWLNKNSLPPTYGLPSPLVSHLRAILKRSDGEPSPEVALQSDKIQEMAIFETIQSIFELMMEGLIETDEYDREDSSWDVKLVLEYKDLQRRIISSVLASCNEALKVSHNP